MTEFNHVTVLLEEAVEQLNIKPDGVYVDCTLGGGGHTSLILSKLSDKGKLFSFDQDQTAIDYNTKRLQNELASKKLTFIKSNFRDLKERLAEQQITKVDGILYDLGVSSPNLM